MPHDVSTSRSAPTAAAPRVAWTGGAEAALRYVLDGNGPCGVILLHELGGSLESWDGVVAALGDDFTVLRYDQRGAGLSEKPRAPFRLDDHVGDLERVIAAAGLAPPYGLAGVAAGAAIAVGFARRHVRDVAALALCAPALSVDADRRRYLADRSAAAERAGMRGVADAALARSYPDELRADRTRFEAYRGRFLANDPVAYAHANRALAAAEPARDLPAIDLPCLVLAGAYDPLRPEAELRDLAARLPRAAFARVASGHLMSVQAPEDLAVHLRAFFRAHVRAAAI